MFRKIFIGSYITIFLLCILSKFLLNTDIFLIYFIVTIIMVSLLINTIFRAKRLIFNNNINRHFNYANAKIL